MGADIHGFVEYSWEKLGKDKLWCPVPSPTPNYDGEHDRGWKLPRSYYLFGKLAGVRAEAGVYPKYQPRGLPKDIGADAFSYFTTRIARFGESPVNNGEEYTITQAQAQVWERRGRRLLSPDRIMSMDFHTHSWLMCHELKNVFEEELAATDEENQLPSAYLEVVTSMEKLVADGCIARFVFGFDN